MAARVLIDTNVLVYRYDHRFPEKQSTASTVLRQYVTNGAARVPHQAVVELVAATTRGQPGDRLLDPAEARREAEEVHGLPELLSEDFQDGRLYGTVTVRNPFAHKGDPRDPSQP